MPSNNYNFQTIISVRLDWVWQNKKTFRQETKGSYFRVATLVETDIFKVYFRLIRYGHYQIPIPFPRSRRETPSVPTKIFFSLMLVGPFSTLMRLFLSHNSFLYSLLYVLILPRIATIFFYYYHFTMIVKILKRYFLLFSFLGKIMLCYNIYKSWIKLLFKII